MPDLENELREAIAERLQGDSTLTSMLALNERWDVPVKRAATAGKDRKWSIVPLSKFKPKNPMPQVTIQMGGDTLAGYNLTETLIYIRCYNSSNKTFVEITDVLARVKALLHRQPLELTGSTTVELVYETTQPELVDQAYDLPFRETRYRLSRV